MVFLLYRSELGLKIGGLHLGGLSREWDEDVVLGRFDSVAMVDEVLLGEDSDRILSRRS